MIDGETGGPAQIGTKFSGLTFYAFTAGDRKL